MSLMAPYSDDFPEVSSDCDREKTPPLWVRGEDSDVRRKKLLAKYFRYVSEGS